MTITWIKAVHVAAFIAFAAGTSGAVAAPANDPDPDVLCYTSKTGEIICHFKIESNLTSNNTKKNAVNDAPRRSGRSSKN
jgi:hypothetical protein